MTAIQTITTKLLAPTSRTRATLVAGLLTAATAVSACTEEPRLATAVAVAGQAPTAAEVEAAAPEGYSYQCLSRPGVVRRIVQVLTESDGNGNGVVCDEPAGLPAEDGSATVFTVDDVLLPIGSQDASSEENQTSSP